MDTNFLSFPKTGLSPLVCLYSGGLDSAAGLVARISESPTRPVFPVTVWHQPRQRHLVDHQYQFLRRHYRERSVAVEINPLIIKVAMSWSSNYAKKHQETSQRSRSFLFTAVGAITAIMNGQRHIEMFESGVGAINLPLMAGMVGSKATKSSHPEFLRTMSKLVSLIADDEVKFTLPFVSKTKGELVSSLAVDDLGSLAHMTASCIHYPIRKKHFKQCGLCPGCIFRRSALRAAGIDEDGNLYGYDFLGQPDLINHLPDNRLRFLSAFLLQVAHLRNIENEERLPSMFERHVVPGIVPKGESQKGVIELLGRYRDEWLEIVAEARERGHAWATLLVPEQPATPRANHVPV
jgi:7-cyano-7-deazaguanine synthase in queuosine biosynthesis